MLPICIGFFCVAESFIQILLGEKWLPCVPYIKIFCIVIFLNSVEAIFSNGPMALGKSTASMALGILECVINILLLIVAVPFGVMAIGYSMIASSFINCAIYFIYLKKLSGFRIIKCLASSFDSVLATLFMGAGVYAAGYLPFPYYVVFAIQIIIGVGAYCLLSKLLKNDSLSYCLSLIKDIKLDDIKIFESIPATLTIAYLDGSNSFRVPLITAPLFSVILTCLF